MPRRAWSRSHSEPPRSWDPKPELAKFDGKSLPNGGTGFASPFQFPKQGKSGLQMSEVWPALSQHADKLAVIRSAYTDIPAHDQATIFMNTGSQQFGRPSMGSWVTYGLGSESQDLPGFVVLTSRDQEASCGQFFYDFYWGAGFLPSSHQGVKLRSGADPVLYLSDPPGIDRGPEGFDAGPEWHVLRWNRWATDLEEAMGPWNTRVRTCPLVAGDEVIPRDSRGRTRTEELRQLSNQHPALTCHFCISDPSNPIPDGCRQGRGVVGGREKPQDGRDLGDPGGRREGGAARRRARRGLPPRRWLSRHRGRLHA